MPYGSAFKPKCVWLWATHATKDSLRPFPWSRYNGEDFADKPQGGSADQDSSVSSNSSSARSGLATPNSGDNNGGKTSDGLDFLDYMLPRQGSTAGSVLQHAKAAMTTLFRKHEPMTFKFGYTHNPIFRWECPLYGYAHDRFNKWSNMVILYESHESYSPAFLEAILIDMYKSTSLKSLEQLVL